MSPYALHSAETKLLLDCCRNAEAGGVWADFDWTSLANRAAASGLLPLAYTWLKRHPGLVPSEKLRLFQAGYLSATAGNLRLIRSLSNVLRELAAKGIPVMLLKGAALLAEVHRDPALRPMQDVDLLVHREDVVKATAVLTACGMHAVESGISLEQYEFEHHHGQPYVADDGSLAVELHHSLVPQGGPIQPLMEEVWRDGRESSIGGLSVLTPSPAHLVLHIAIHACTPTPFDPPLRCLFDISQTVLKHGSVIDWELFVETARTWNAAREAWCCLFFSHGWMPSGIPDAALRRLEAACKFRLGEGWALRRVVEYLVLRPMSARAIPPWLQERIFNLALHPAPLSRKFLGASGILLDGLEDSAHTAAPSVPRWALPLYALLLHPFVLLARNKSTAAHPKA